jgi:hypothetical protein
MIDIRANDGTVVSVPDAIIESSSLNCALWADPAVRSGKAVASFDWPFPRRAIQTLVDPSTDELHANAAVLDFSGIPSTVIWWSVDFRFDVAAWSPRSVAEFAEFVIKRAEDFGPAWDFFEEILVLTNSPSPEQLGALATAVAGQYFDELGDVGHKVLSTFGKESAEWTLWVSAIRSTVKDTIFEDEEDVDWLALMLPPEDPDSTEPILAHQGTSWAYYQMLKRCAALRCKTVGTDRRECSKCSLYFCQDCSVMCVSCGTIGCMWCDLIFDSCGECGFLSCETCTELSAGAAADSKKGLMYNPCQSCSDCSMYVCHDCVNVCVGCREPCCRVHDKLIRCAGCEKNFCGDCVAYCSSCSRAFCDPGCADDDMVFDEEEASDDDEAMDGPSLCGHTRKG